MKSFYSILQIPIRPAGQEQLNIGLLFVGDGQSYFKFSNKKLEFIKKLIPSGSHNLLRSYLFGLSEKMKVDNEAPQSKFRNPDFVSYLSNYNNNLLVFSKPVAIDLEVNEKNYQTLFEKFVFSFDEDAEVTIGLTPVSLQHQLKTNLYPKIKLRVNLDKTLTTKEIPSLLVPSVKVNFIGQNYIQVAGQGVDFEMSPEKITNSVSRLISLIKAFELDTAKKGKYFIIGKEPDKSKFDEQHRNWEHIKTSGLIEFVDINETESISEYVEKHNVRPFVVAD
jgi:hypothetical protein